MLIRYFIFSLIVCGFAWLARAIVKGSRHLENRQLRRCLLVIDDEAGRAASARRRIRQASRED